MSDTKTPIEYADEILNDKEPHALRIAKELREAEGNRELLDQAAQCLEDDCDYLKTIAESIKASLHDNAKLREALIEIERKVNSLDENCAVDPVEIRDIARAALAAPARNCDSYDSADEMMEEYADDAFLEEWKEWRKSGKCHQLMIDAFLCINWLFLTNKKEDSDGSK